jgi:hypothetical protein
VLSEYCASICHKKIEVVEARRMTSVDIVFYGEEYKEVSDAWKQITATTAIMPDGMMTLEAAIGKYMLGKGQQSNEEKGTSFRRKFVAMMRCGQIQFIAKNLLQDLVEWPERSKREFTQSVLLNIGQYKAYLFGWTTRT